MKNNETKNEWVLRELYIIKEFTTGRVYKPGRTNIHNMATDCIDVIEDLNKQIEILQREKQLIIWNHDPSRKLDLKMVMADLDFDKTEVKPDGSIFVPFNEQPEFMDEILKLRAREILTKNKMSDILADMITTFAPRDEIAIAIEQSKVVIDTEKLREQLRGDICE